MAVLYTACQYLLHRNDVSINNVLNATGQLAGIVRYASYKYCLGQKQCLN
jgi:hypothetical protein